MAKSTIMNSLKTWFTLRRRCSWCRGWLGGNPLASRVTDGICPQCAAKVLRGIRIHPLARTPDYGELAMEILGWVLCVILFVVLLIY